MDSSAPKWRLGQPEGRHFCDGRMIWRPFGALIPSLPLTFDVEPGTCERLRQRIYESIGSCKVNFAFSLNRDRRQPRALGLHSTVWPMSLS
jgi:hypothetical protein